MKVGIIFGGVAREDGTLEPHGKARIEEAIELYKNGQIDMIIACGDASCRAITSYLESNGVERDKIIKEPYGCSTLSELYYSKILLILLSQKYPIDRVALISNHWHIPRISFDVGRIPPCNLVSCHYAQDPRDEEKIKTDERLEKIKSFYNRFLLGLGYGEEVDAENLKGLSVENFDIAVEIAAPYPQKRLMWLEKQIHSAWEKLEKLWFKIRYSSTKAKNKI